MKLQRKHLSLSAGSGGAVQNTILRYGRLQICVTAAGWVVLGVALLLGGAASGQNLLRNADFESPLSTNDWVVQLSAPGIPSTNAYGGPGDFAIADRTTEGSRIAGGYGAHFRSRTDWTTRAYFSQTVSNLTPGVTYHLSGYMKVTYDDTNKFHAYIEAVGGSGDPTGDGRFTLRTVDAITGSTQSQYFLDQTADANGRIEVRLRWVKLAMTPGAISYPKFVQYSAYFDDFSLTP
jgi:hypothetical protein